MKIGWLENTIKSASIKISMIDEVSCGVSSMVSVAHRQPAGPKRLEFFTEVDSRSNMI